MLLRATLLSALMLVTLAVTLPFADSAAKNNRAHVSSQSKRFKRYSRAWWRQRRAAMRRRQIAQRRRTELAALRNKQTGDNIASMNNDAAAFSSTTRPTSFNHAGSTEAPRGANSAVSVTLPARWGGNTLPVGGEMRFRMTGADGKQIGAAAFAPFGVAISGADANASGRNRWKQIGGVPVATLRRTVIDKMFAEGGWVTNDVQKEIGGRRLFIVFANKGDATTAAGVAAHTLAYYFIELDGRIYSLVTNAPVESASTVATDAEQFVANLRTPAPKPQTAIVAANTNSAAR